ncbi:MAG TPA: hypothetical protein VEG32_00335 [Clostridia bacterium]|nr:hypothetical protein [Clostridia bacterium]
MLFVNAIDLSTTPAPGATIVKFKIYDNNRRIYESFDTQTGGVIFNALVRNGRHNVVVNAWDSLGNLYQSRVSFNVIGEGFATSCPPPVSPGINFCVPPLTSFPLGTTYRIIGTAKGVSRITAMRLYVDHMPVSTLPGVSVWNTQVFTGTQGNHRISLVAWDSAGRSYRSSRIIRSSYRYGYMECPKDACTPGFDDTPGSGFSPDQNDYVGNSFTIRAEIKFNPLPITAMKAYIDNTVFAVSNGPIMNFPVTDAPTGTHILTLQAWDTAGVLYRVAYNININVPH